jgi:hypothetical protein
MTAKAQNIINRIRQKDRSRRNLARLTDPGYRNRLLESLNRDTMDAAAPVGNGQMTILKDIESLGQEHDQYMENLRVDRSGV